MSTTTESDQAHDLWVVQQGAGPDVLLIGGLGDPVESWQFQLDGARRQLPDDRVRQPGRGTVAAPRRAVHGRVDGGRRRERAAGRRDRLRTRGRLLRRERDRPRARDPPPRPGAQPRAGQHLGEGRRLLRGDGPRVAVDGHQRADRARVPRGVLRLDLHPPGPPGRHREPDRRGEPGVPARRQRRGDPTHRSTPSSRTRRPTGCRRSACQRSCSRARRTWPRPRTTARW